MDEEQATEANAMEEMEKSKASVKELEERRALTKGGDEVQVPKMNIKVRLLRIILTRTIFIPFTGCCPEWKGENAESAFHLAYRCVSES